MTGKTKPEKRIERLCDLAAKLEKRIEDLESVGRNPWQDRADASALRFALQELDALQSVLVLMPGAIADWIEDWIEVSKEQRLLADDLSILRTIDWVGHCRMLARNAGKKTVEIEL